MTCVFIKALGLLLLNHASNGLELFLPCAWLILYSAKHVSKSHPLATDFSCVLNWGSLSLSINTWAHHSKWREWLQRPFSGIVWCFVSTIAIIWHFAFVPHSRTIAPHLICAHIFAVAFRSTIFLQNTNTTTRCSTPIWKHFPFII